MQTLKKSIKAFIKPIFSYLHEWLDLIFCFIRTRLMSETEKDMEISALRWQLSIFQQQTMNGKLPKPQVSLAFRQFWVFLSTVFDKWELWLVIFKPETVVGWHRKSFKLYWSFKSRKRGRPQISRKTIALIKRIHKENPLLSPEKIHEQYES